MFSNAFNGLKNDRDWYDCNVLSLEPQINRDVSCISNKKFDLPTESNDCFGVFEQREDKCTVSLNLNVPPVNCKYWKNSNTIFNVPTNTQTQNEVDQIQEIPLIQQKNKNLNYSLHNTITNIQTTVNRQLYKPVSRSCSRTTIQSPHHSKNKPGSVEIKVEVDPNLYVNCETSVDNDHWSDSYQKTNKCPININNCITSQTQNNSPSRNGEPKHIDTKKFKDGSILKEQDVANILESRYFNNDSVKLNSDDGSEISQETENEMTDGSDDSGLSVKSSESKDSSSRDLALMFGSEKQLDKQLTQFYKCRCLKCANNQIFTSFELLVQHCKDKHHVEACVSCCGKSFWDKDTLVKHMLKHKNAYR